MTKSTPLSSPSPAEPPKRIQRKRTKGWKMPVGAVYVGRPTRWGNPYSVNVRGTRERSLDQFRAYVSEMNPDVRAGWLADLRGKTLMCFCPLGVPCHGDVLLELANAD